MVKRGGPRRLDFPGMLLLMRFFGLLVFTAVIAYAIAVTPALKWAFMLIFLASSPSNPTSMSIAGSIILGVA
jgi:hypothetical protein